MPELTRIPDDALARCEERARRLAMEKSYLQLVNNLMMQLSAVKGVETVVEKVLGLLLDNLGGSNVSLTYRIDSTLHWADVFGNRKEIDRVDDEIVQRAFSSRELVEVEHDFEQTKMLTPEFTKASTWAVPLMAGDELVGVLKLEDMLMAAEEVRRQLEPFLRYATLVLKNEISGQSTLRKAYDELRETNARLSDEIKQRQEAESILRVTQFAVDHASDCLFWIRPDASFANINGAACRRLGYSREELLCLTVFDVDPEFSRQAWDAHWQEIEERKTFTIETKHKTKGGEIFPVEVTVNYIEYEGAAYNFAFGRDISDRKRVEEALRLAKEGLEHAIVERTAELQSALALLQEELTERRRVEEQLQITQFAVDSSADAIFWVNPDGSFMYWNKAARDLLGYSSQELLTIKTFDLNPEHQGAGWLAHWQELRTQGFLRFETVLARKDGVRIPVEITANLVRFQGQEYNCAFIRDIGERKKIEAALQDSNERFRAFMDYAPFYAYVKDADLNHIYANKKTLALIPSPKPEEMRSALIFPEELVRTLEEADRRILAGATEEELEYQASLAGDIVWLKDIKFPITLSDGRRLVGGVAIDITEPKRLGVKIAKQGFVNAVMSEMTKNVLIAESIEVMAIEILTQARRVTGSQFGYAGYIDRSTGFLVCPTMPHDIWDQCGVAGKSIVFEQRVGLWGWVLDNKQPLMTNNPAADSRSTGTPPGHLPIRRFLSVPAFYGDSLVGQIALANAERDYTDEDVAMIERMAAIFALGVRRKQAEEELRLLNEDLEQRVALRTAEIEKKKAELERMNKLFVGRELRMVELKEKIKELEKQSGGESPSTAT